MHACISVLSEKQLMKLTGQDFLIPGVQLGELRLRELNERIQGHTASKKAKQAPTVRGISDNGSQQGKRTDTLATVGTFSCSTQSCTGKPGPTHDLHGQHIGDS